MFQEVKGKAAEDQEAPASALKADLASQTSWRRLVAILDQPFLADQDFSGHIDLREGAVLGLALMLNNLPNGVAAGMLRLPVAPTILVVVLLSIITFWVGIGLGQNIAVRWLGKRAWVVSGLVLIGLGLLEIISVV